MQWPLQLISSISEAVNQLKQLIWGIVAVNSSRPVENKGKQRKDGVNIPCGSAEQL